MTNRVGPYVLGRTLGVGSTGRVKLGVHMDNANTVAIKIISKDFLNTKASLSKKMERCVSCPPIWISNVLVGKSRL